MNQIPLKRNIDSDRPMVLFGLALTGFAVYLHALFLAGAQALWRDEVNSVNMAAKPLPELWQALAIDTHPILYSLALKVWGSVIGTDDWSLRLFGFLTGLLILAMLWRTLRAFGYPAPTISLALLGMSPIIVRYGDSLRPYGLSILLLGLLFGSVWKITQQSPPRLTTLAEALILSVLAVQCLYQSALIVLAICAAGIAVCARNSLRKPGILIAGIGVISGLSLLPYLGIFRDTQEWSVLFTRPLSGHELWSDFLQTLSYPAGWLGWVWGFLFFGSLATASLLLFRGASEPFRRQKDAALFAVTAMLVGVTVTFAFMMVLSRPLYYWHYLPLMALVGLCLDVAISAAPVTPAIRMRGTQMALTGAVALGLFFPARPVVSERQTNIDLAASQLRAVAQKDDLIVVNPWHYGVTFSHYYRGAAPWLSVPPLEDLSVHRYDLLKERMAEPDALSPVLTRIEETLRSGGRVWVVGGLPYLPRNQLPPVLPPAPHGPEGWFFAPYEIMWGQQAAYFAQVHAQEIRSLSLVDTGSVSSLENVRVDVLQGWR